MGYKSNRGYYKITSVVYEMHTATLSVVLTNYNHKGGTEMATIERVYNVRGKNIKNEKDLKKFAYELINEKNEFETLENVLED